MLNRVNIKIMVLDGEKIEEVNDFMYLGFKINIEVI